MPYKHEWQESYSGYINIRQSGLQDKYHSRNEEGYHIKIKESIQEITVLYVYVPNHLKKKWSKNW